MPSGNLHSGGKKRRVGRNLHLCIRTCAHATLSLFSSLYSLPTVFLSLYHLYTDSFQCTSLPHKHFLWDSPAYLTSQVDVSQTSWSQYIKIGTHNGPSPNLVVNTNKWRHHSPYTVVQEREQVCKSFLTPSFSSCFISSQPQSPVNFTFYFLNPSTLLHLGLHSYLNLGDSRCYQTSCPMYIAISFICYLKYIRNDIFFQNDI